MGGLDQECPGSFVAPAPEAIEHSGRGGDWSSSAAGGVGAAAVAANRHSVHSGSPAPSSAPAAWSPCARGATATPNRNRTRQAKPARQRSKSPEEAARTETSWIIMRTRYHLDGSVATLTFSIFSIRSEGSCACYDRHEVGATHLEVTETSVVRALAPALLQSHYHIVFHDWPDVRE